jgi:hypothetical protein
VSSSTADGRGGVPPLPASRRGSRRRKPKHALQRPRRRTDRGTTIGLVVILVLTSAFVAGTTATFTASTTNPNNNFATTALRAPTGAAVTGVGDDMKITWTAPATFTPDGYRITEKDHGAALPSNLAAPTSCSSVTSGYDSNEVGLLAHHDVPTTHTFTDLLSLGTHANHLDGRLWCYRVQSRTPCCVTGSSAWLSQTSGNQTGYSIAQGTYGMTLTAFSSTHVAGVRGDTGGTGKLNPNDYFDFTFSQPMDTGTAPSGSICVRGTSPGQGVYIGMSGTTGACAYAGTETLNGFILIDSTNPTQNSRYNMSVSYPSCPASPTSCSSMRITVGTNINGTKSPTVSQAGTFTIQGTAGSLAAPGIKLDAYGDPTNSITSRNWCASGTPTNVFTGVTTIRYMADPTNGRCTFSGISVGI